MTNVNNYDLSLNLLDGAYKSLANASKNLELLREGTAFNQVLNDTTHIIEPDELIHILDNSQSSILTGKSVLKLTMERLVKNSK